MSYESVKYECADGIARITLSRPDRLNSFTAAMHEELRDALGRVVGDGARVLLLTAPITLRPEYAARFHMRSELEAGFVYTTFNMDFPELGYNPDPERAERNHALRCAIVQAINWEAQNNSWYAGLGIIFPGIIPPILPEFDPELSRASVTYDPAAADFWLVDDYFPGIRELDRRTMPSLEELRRVLGPIDLRPVPIPHDCTDGLLGAYWRRPEAYLDAGMRSAISAFAAIPDVDVGVARLRADLDDGTWERRYGHLLELPALDLYAVDDAIQWMLDRLNASEGWQSLSRFLPEGALEGLRVGEMRARSGLASTFVASLELARQRLVALRQARPFGPIALCALKERDAAQDRDRE